MCPVYFVTYVSGSYPSTPLRRASLALRLPRQHRDLALQHRLVAFENVRRDDALFGAHIQMYTAFHRALGTPYVLCDGADADAPDHVQAAGRRRGPGPM